LNLNRKSSLIDQEQTQLLYAGVPFSIVASIFNVSLLVYVERSVISQSVLLTWLIVLFIVTFSRGLSLALYKREKPWPVTDLRWRNVNLFGVLLSALVWGGASISLFSHQSIPHQAFLGFVIAGMSAGAISTLSSSRAALLIFLSCILTPLAIQFFMVGTEFGIVMGSMIVLYYFIIISAGINNYTSWVQNIDLRLTAEEQKKELKASEEKYLSIFKSAPLGILHYSPDGTITSQNDMALNLIEISDSALQQINLRSDINDSEFLTAITQSLEGKLGQYKGSTKVIFSLSDKPIRMYCQGTYDATDNISGGVAILEDITEENRTDQLKNEFVSTVSHELRTPLTAIYGATKLLQSDNVTISKEKIDALIDNISRNSDRLIQLVNDILDMEKISTGKMDFHFEKVELSMLLDQAVTDNQSYAKKYNVTFVLKEFSQNVQLMVDKNRFQQVMANLLSNAAKFSPENSEIQVGGILVNSFVRIYVQDAGPGIAKDFQDKIFEKFTQYDSTDTRKVGGTGLGLSISKEIIEKMNGHLDFDTELNKGSVFYFELPIARL